MRKLLAIIVSCLFHTSVFAAAFGQFMVNGPSPLPPGVTLQQIDGGPTYYATNGFTNAAAKGWDGASFFPIGVWLAPLASQTVANRWIAAGWNEAVGDGGITSSLLTTNSFEFTDDVQAGTALTTLGAATLASGELIRIETFDEPANYAQAATTSISGVANASQNGMAWVVNNTWTQLYSIAFNQVSFNNFIIGGGFTGTVLSRVQQGMSNPIATPNSTTRHLNIQGIDEYYFSGVAPCANWTSFFGGTPYEAGLIYTNTGTAGGSCPGWSFGYTVDQTARAIHYGDTIDLLRSANSISAPIYSFIETGQPYTASGFQYYITPPQLNAAAWSSIIHGAREIVYFDHTFDPTSGQTSDDNIDQTFYQTVQNGTGGAITTNTNWGSLGGPTVTTSITAQLAATDTFIQTMAPQLNSPFALGYASVSPAGWTYGQSAMQGTATSTLSGFDIMTKYYNSSKFYVFVQPRYSQTLTSQTATVTLPSGTTGSVAVCGESRSISISANSFSDTFADGNTVHIYGVNTSC